MYLAHPTTSKNAFNVHRRRHCWVDVAEYLVIFSTLLLIDLESFPLGYARELIFINLWVEFPLRSALSEGINV